MTGLISDISQLNTNQSLMQDFYDRLDAVEDKQAASPQMLHEYARNFDVMDKHFKDLLSTVTDHYNDINKWCNDTVDKVSKINIVVDEKTLKDLEKLVTAKTGFNLQSYISKVQTKAINDCFKVVTDKVDELTELQDKSIKQQNGFNATVNNLLSYYQLFTYALIFSALIVSFAMIPLYVWCLSNHLWWTLFLIVTLGSLSFYGWHNLNKDDNDGDDKNEHSNK